MDQYDATAMISGFTTLFFRVSLGQFATDLTCYSIHILAAMTNNSYTDLAFSDEFRRVLSVRFCTHANLFFLCSCIMPFLLQTRNIAVSNFQNNLLIFQTLNTFLRFSFA